MQKSSRQMRIATGYGYSYHEATDGRTPAARLAGIKRPQCDDCEDAGNSHLDNRIALYGQGASIEPWGRSHCRFPGMALPLK
jgi:hypothetical protein